MIDKMTEMNISELTLTIHENKIIREKIIKDIESSKLNESDKLSLLIKVKLAYNRINAPLSLGERFIYFFFPFGYIYDGFFKIKMNFVKENGSFLKDGYVRKQKEMLIFSLLGSSTFIILFMLLFKYLMF